MCDHNKYGMDDPGISPELKAFAESLPTAPQNSGSQSAGASGYAHIHVCSQPGMTMDETRVEQLPDGTWRAAKAIGTIFGAEVEGECVGKGATKEEALAALKKDQDGLYD